MVLSCCLELIHDTQTIFSQTRSCPKVANHCHICSQSRTSQGLHTSNSFRELYQVSLLIDGHQIFGSKQGDASGRNTPSEATISERL